MGRIGAALNGSPVRYNKRNFGVVTRHIYHIGNFYMRTPTLSILLGIQSRQTVHICVEPRPCANPHTTDRPRPSMDHLSYISPQYAPPSRSNTLSPLPPLPHPVQLSRRRKPHTPPSLRSVGTRRYGRPAHCRSSTASKRPGSLGIQQSHQLSFTKPHFMTHVVKKKKKEKR